MNAKEQFDAAVAFRPKLEAAIEFIKVKQAEWIEAGNARVRLEGAHRNEQWPRERRQQVLEAALRESASPRISEAIKDLRAEFSQIFQLSDEVTEGYSDRLRIVWSNRAAVQARAAAIRELISTIDGLVFESLDDEQLEKRLQKLRAALPVIDVRPEKYRAAVA